MSCRVERRGKRGERGSEDSGHTPKSEIDNDEDQHAVFQRHTTAAATAAAATKINEQSVYFRWPMAKTERPEMKTNTQQKQ